MKQDYLVYINQAHIIALIIPVNIKYLHQSNLCQSIISSDGLLRPTNTIKGLAVY